MIEGGTDEVPWWIILLVSPFNVELQNLFVLGAGMCMLLGDWECVIISLKFT